MSEEQFEMDQGKVKPRLNLVDISDVAKKFAMRLTNYQIVAMKNKEVKVPIPAMEIYETFERLTGKSVKRLEETPFVMNGKEIKMLYQAKDLFAYLGCLDISAQWAENVTGGVSKSEFHSIVQTKAEKFTVVSDVPNYPPVEGIFYSRQVEPKQTGKLDELVSKFAVASEVDGAFLKAMFMSPFWGGDGGQRPAFLVDGLENPEDPSKGNKGIGKSTVSEILGDLAGGGTIDISHKADDADIRKAIINSSKLRIVRLDNIKTQSLSNETLESLITAKFISGHRMFCGHASIPNIFTYCLTFNDAVLSKDMSQRCIIIRLKRTPYNSEWRNDVDSFVKNNRNEIYADIGFNLVKEGAIGTGACRFPAWERHVLSKCGDQIATGARIAQDQIKTDEQQRLEQDIREVIHQKIAVYYRAEGGTNAKRYFDAETDTFALNRSIIFDWLGAELFVKGMARRTIAKRFDAARPIEFLPKTFIHKGAYYFVWSGARKEDKTFEPASTWKLDINGTVTVESWVFKSQG